MEKILNDYKGCEDQEVRRIARNLQYKFEGIVHLLTIVGMFFLYQMAIADVRYTPLFLIIIMIGYLIYSIVDDIPKMLILTRR